MFDLFCTVIERDTYSSLLYAVLGGLMILSTYHLMLFFQNRNSSYFLYSSYTFFLLLAYIPLAEEGFLVEITRFFGFDNFSKQFFTIIFNCIYFLFLAAFLRVKYFNKLWYRIITAPVLILIILATLSYLIMMIWHLASFFMLFNKAFVYLIAVHTLISFYILLQIKNHLKYYIMFGGIVLFICSLIGEHSIRQLPWLNLSRKAGDFIFYIGVLLENSAFSFALGHQQKFNYREKVSVHHNFIAEMKKNEILKDIVNMENQKRLIFENEQIKYLQEISDLKLSVLQSQINPHFIFNALNSVRFYILENEPQIAANYLTKFSKIIRTILTASTMKEFTLEEEIHTLQVYMDIENLRFDNGIDFKIETGPEIDLQKIKIPPLVLQPFIENAILHGVATVVNKKITLAIVRNSDRIEISITDNGIGRIEAAKTQSHPKSRQSMGIKIVHGMLKNYFGPAKYQILYSDLEENGECLGTRVLLQIPAEPI